MEKLEQVIVDKDCKISHFISVVELLIRRPHLIKSRKNFVAGAKIISQEPLERIPDQLQFIDDFQNKFLNGDFQLEADDVLIRETDYAENALIIRQIIYKNDSVETSEAVLWQLSATSASIDVVPLSIDKDGTTFVHTKCHFKIEFDIENSRLSLFMRKSCNENISDDSTLAKWVQWLRFVCFVKTVDWLNEKLPPPSSQSISLKLVKLDKYQTSYSRLKKKYFDKLAEAWKSESTNPEKFIHEDLSIAAYLLALWEDEDKKPESFLDLGCGNGLLVYLLTQEGYKGGVGVDLRRRKIWDFFLQSGTDLRVETFVPKPEPLLKEYDWVIGNHSDELTPWIPLMSSLSRSKFFLLPCCAFDFYAKFQRKNNKTSIYRDYLDFVQRVGEQCGFVMEEDRLRIPSTKRICFVGRKFEHSLAVDQFIKSLDEKGNNFEARPVIETIRNCTKVDKNVQNEILQIVVDKLLKESQQNFKGTWNCGGTIPISSISAEVPARLLAEIKNECGGIQTLFRNYRYIFVVENGTVRLRIPGVDDMSSSGKRKQKAKDLIRGPSKKLKSCWFFQNHPQGCPLEDNQCNWIHSEGGDEKRLKTS